MNDASEERVQKVSHIVLSSDFGIIGYLIAH